MYRGMSPHVVLLTRVSEEVRLRAGLDAGIKERQAVLWYYRRVVITRDNLQLAFQIFGLVDETALSITFGVILRGAHIALTQSITGPPATPTLNTSG